jgi:hypothetical protein
MALPVEFEILIPLVIALFFSFLYETDKDEHLWAGMIAMVVWLSSSLLFLIVSSYPVIAFVFMAVWILYLIRIVIQLFKPLQERRRLEGDTS